MKIPKKAQREKIFPKSRKKRGLPPLEIFFKSQNFLKREKTQKFFPQKGGGKL
ncbi:hypothetical protein EBI_26728 [Enterocytozoon bieneusi H348]|nr:hypothetical protein EBI_26728 [Enterocytozoon bieneusi H348]|eukprot:XP_002651451.1 hypothetical protein EBI_26728 [Enterocytozoon bieneusi H348]